MKERKNQYIIAGILLAIGAVFLVLQLINGFSGYVGHYAWGLYIACFFAAAAGGAGVLIIAGVAQLLKQITPQEAAKLYFAALALFITAGVLIVADLGSPLAIIYMLLSPNLAAPMNFDALLLVIAVVFAFVAARKNLKAEQGSPVLAGVGIAVASVLLFVESWLLAISVRQDIWAVMMGAGPALIQALVIALAIAILCTGKTGVWMKALVISALALLVVESIDLFAGVGNQNHLGTQMSLLIGSVSFWIAMVGLLAVALAGILAKDKMVPKAMSIVALLAVTLMKLSILWAGQAAPALEQISYSGQAHLPVSEILIVVGIVALGFLAYGLLSGGLGKRETGGFAAKGENM